MIHYHRADGDYGDYTSSDFTDFWGLHVWTGAPTETAVDHARCKPVRVDSLRPGVPGAAGRRRRTA